MRSWRCLGLGCVLAMLACGRFDFADRAGDAGPAPDDVHLHASAGGTIAPYVDLTGVLPYNPDDFTNTNGSASETSDNAPHYVAALYPPFASSFAVLAGRSLIEVGDAVTVHDYRPAMPDKTGPDALSHGTVATFEAKTGLWITSTSLGNGDGLFFIASDWSIVIDSDDTIDTRFNNMDAIVADPSGAFDALGTPQLYDSGQSNSLLRQTGPNAAVTLVLMAGFVDDLALVGSALFAVVELTDTGTPVQLQQISPGPSYIRTNIGQPFDELVLAEGSTANGLFGIAGAANLVAIDPGAGSTTLLAWSDDPAWQWVAVSAPRAGHALAGKLIVLESNRTLDRDRLLVVTPP